MDTCANEQLNESLTISAEYEHGWWTGDQNTLINSNDNIRSAIGRLNEPVFILKNQQQQYCATAQGTAVIGPRPGKDALPLLGFAPASSPQQLGDAGFCQDHGLYYPYMCGAMANGIASVALVKAAAAGGLLGSFGAAGLMLDEIEQAVTALSKSLYSKPFCCNLIFSPNEKGHEDAVVSLYIKHGIHLIEASAYMKLTLPVVRYRVHGIHQNSAGDIETPNRIIAKASRTEVAGQWFSPPPEKMLAKLISSGDITEQQADLARQIPMAQDVTVEADSGGHTDNRPAITLLPTMIALRDRMQKQFNYKVPLRIGAAGGIATPSSAAGAFAMGAAYIVTGTINQACIESGSSDIARQMLAEARQADVAMAPAVDMFEMGVKLQVLKRGTMFAMRGNKLYELYRSYDSIDDLPAQQRKSLEQSIFRMPLSEVWALTQDFFKQRDPDQLDKAARDPKHKMSLIFRWYLGLSSRWANIGEGSRQMDYQIWCGPAMGAFNEWTKNSYLSKSASRNIETVALNILYGATVISRINNLRNQGVKLSNTVTRIVPLTVAEIEARIN